MRSQVCLQGLVSSDSQCITAYECATLEPDSGPPERLADYSFGQLVFGTALSHLIKVSVKSPLHNLKVMLVSTIDLIFYMSCLIGADQNSPINIYRGDKQK